MTKKTITLAKWVFLGFCIGLLAGVLLSGCTIAPKGVQAGQATISETGKADSGFVRPERRNGVGGWLVTLRVRANYTALLSTYGSRLSPPSPDVLTGWDLTPRADGLLWCSNAVAFDYGVMNFLSNQDAKLQTKP